MKTLYAETKRKITEYKAQLRKQPPITGAFGHEQVTELLSYAYANVGYYGVVDCDLWDMIVEFEKWCTDYANVLADYEPDAYLPTIQSEGKG